MIQMVVQKWSVAGPCEGGGCGPYLASSFWPSGNSRLAAESASANARLVFRMLVFMGPLPSSPCWATCLVSGLSRGYYAAGTGSIDRPAIFAASRLAAAGQADSGPAAAERGAGCEGHLTSRVSARSMGR